MASSRLDDILCKFNGFTLKPAKFLAVQEESKDDIKSLVKNLYDFTKSQEGGNKNEKKSALSELIIEEFDEEQIWQQIELQNTEHWDRFVWDVSNFMSIKDTLKFPVEIPEDVSEASEDNLPSDAENDVEMPSESEEIENIKKPKTTKQKLPKQKVKCSIVDDSFFKLQDMEKFLLKEEKTEPKAGLDSDDESIDMFDDIESEGSEGEEDGNKDMMYNDFFDNDDENEDLDHNKRLDEENDNGFDENDKLSEKESTNDNKPQSKDKKKVKFSGISSDDDSDIQSDTEKTKTDNKQHENEKKSDFELRQQRLQQTITRLEEKTLKEAPWQLKGNVDAAKRPQNSLLEEVVDFDLTTRPAPIITEETTLTLEEIIRRRIKDKAWDDVERKEKPVDDQLKFRKTEILDQSKSKLSLAQVYEAEYLKQKQALSGEVQEEEEPEAHKQIREAMQKLFSKLDALCHYHYTPKAAQAEVKIVTNTPAISMEEVAPVATSDATLLAPEEVKRKKKGDLMSKEERTNKDKNRERRKKKKLQRKKGGVQKVTDHRNTKKGVEANDKSLKTSKAFFQQLNDDATSVIKKKNKSKGQ